MRVLILDEDEVSLFVTKHTLAEKFDVHGFSKIENAKSWAASNAFDLFIMEYNPRRDRQMIDVLDQIRSAAPNTRSEFLAIIFTLTRIHASRSKELHEAGFNKIYLRPLSYHPLIGFVRDIQETMCLK